MPVRPAVVIVAAVASLSLVAPPASGAARTFRGHWPLNERKAPAVAHDTSGHRHNGTNFHIRGDGDGYTFNGKNSRVVVPNAGILNPKAADFSFGAKLKMTAPPMPLGATYDILRKGLVTTAGGDYKFEVKNVGGVARARCVVRSIRADNTKVLISVMAIKDLADGKFHVVNCIKTAAAISVQVDNGPLRSNAPADGLGLGAVSNTSSLALGAKGESTASTGFDWFKGVISNSWVASP
jgi:hypothetical protein